MSEDDATTQRRAPGGGSARASSSIERQRADAAQALFRVGDLIADKYRVERVLGTGGMGVVLAVRHLQLGEPFALKFLRSEVLGDAPSVERFLREARAAVRIKSEHVVHVSDVGQLPNGAPYIVMEYLSGCDLAQLLSDRGTLPIQEAVTYVIQACAGIGEAHANGIVHRDLKPSNLFLTTRSDGAPLVKVLDFGISKVEAVGGAIALTATHDVFGSPAYMPPEQIRSAKNVDARSDVWALGVILHELLTGTLPFDGETAGALLAAISVDAPRSARRTRPEIDEALDAIIQRCLQKPPGARFSSVAELAITLAPFAPSAALPRHSLPAPSATPPAAARFAATEKRRPRRTNRIAIAALAVSTLLALVGAVFYARREKDPDREGRLPADVASSTSKGAIVDASHSTTSVLRDGSHDHDPDGGADRDPASGLAEPSGGNTDPHAITSSSAMGTTRTNGAGSSPRAKPHAPVPNDSKTVSPATSGTATKREPNGAIETSH